MISRPMPPAPPRPAPLHSDATMTPLPYQATTGPHSGYPSPIRRTKSFSFGPRNLPPVNKVTGSPRLYG